MDYLPLFHRLQGRTVLVVGGGDVALRKARLLASAGARLRIVAPRIHDALRPLAAELHQRPYIHHDLDGAVLAVAATNNRPLNATLSEQAQARGIPVNVVDSPDLCSALFPAIVDRSPLLVAVGSGGHAPVLARLVRAKIETWLPARYGHLAGLAQRFRQALKARLPGVQQRRVFWEETFQGPIAEAVFAGRTDQAQRLLEARLAHAAPQPLAEVYWVSAGPGNPDLLSFRALRLMQQADIILHDPAVPPAIVDLCRRDADRATHPCTRAAEFARQGKRVLLLRAAEAPTPQCQATLDALAAQGIPFQVVPGIRPAGRPPAPS